MSLMLYTTTLISDEKVIPAKAGIQKDTGFRIKCGMTDSLTIMSLCIITGKATATIPVSVTLNGNVKEPNEITNPETVKATATKHVSVTCEGNGNGKNYPPNSPLTKGGHRGVRRNGLRYRDRLTSSLLFIFSFMLIFIYGCGAPKHYIRPEVDISNIKSIAVLPLENFTSDEYADEKIRRIVITELLLRGIDVIEPGEVTRVLRESNIRSLGSIKITDIQNIGKNLGVEAVMMGSVEAFGISKGISVTYPEVSIHLTLLESSSGNIVWSALHTTGGASFWTRHFGAEGISLSEAARKAVKEAVSTLF